MGIFLMHENSLDVCIEVLKRWKFKPGETIYKVYWWNLGYTGNPWRLHPIHDKITVKDEDINKWKSIGHTLLIPRTKPGLP